MKTAMQELFSQLEIEHPNLFNTNTLEGRKFINDYYKFFEIEKKQITEAFDLACVIIKQSLDVACEDENRIGIEYYNQTFKTN
jgi:hypothetical protein